MKKNLVLLLLSASLGILAYLLWSYYDSPRHEGRVVLDNGAELAWTPCWFKRPEKTIVRCAHFFPPDTVKHDPQTRIRIPVVYFQVGKQPDPYPVLYVAGGPGYATGLRKRHIPGWAQWVKQSGWKHDVVFFDHRGTGLSQPSIACPGLAEFSIDNLGAKIAPEQELKDWFDFSKKCYQHLRNKKIDLSRYTTTATANDVENLTRLIKARKWNLYGVSYGTRVVLELMKRNPKNINSVVLDSVYPTEINELLVVPELMAFTFRTLFENCKYKYFCSKKMPALQQDLTRLIQRLDDKPHTFQVKPSAGEASIPVVINGYRLAWMLYMAMYHWDIIEDMPDTIGKALRVGPQKLKPIVVKYTRWTLDKTFSPAAYYSVECHDREVPVSEQMYADEVEKYPYVKPYVALQWKYDVCRFWDSGRAPKAFFAATHSTIPTLILNGELDPVTPWYWADKVAKTLPNSFFFKIPGVGHGAVDSDECAAKLAAKFLHDPAVRPALDCEKRWGRPDFKFSD